ncbi:hypothetical protein GQ607_010596 [Colletotrichum asianum]|uniref:2EXR domain-containing protein n=1 Tax=Colletotrichum asianum TaxID=702518 RepID=A0A8H3W6E1_9PEZI|nr:hypothetical protein GQ607_010596 [Colletotrichum asianum]
MATTTFYHFADLPTELRLHIWELAACTAAQPRIHFIPIDFDAYHIWKREKTLLCRSETGNVMDTLRALMLLDKRETGKLLSPKTMPRGTLSWVENNESDYLIDAGMWTACKESTRVLIQERQRGRMERKDSEDAQRPKFGTFREGDEDWVFDVDSVRDVFCFDFSQLTVPNRNMDIFWDAVYFPHEGLRKIAVEFDPSWTADIKSDLDLAALGRMYHERGPRGFFVRLLRDTIENMEELRYLPKIFLLDRTVRRVPGKDSYGDLVEFHSQGRTFGTVITAWDLMEETLASDKMNALDFLEAIDVRGFWGCLDYDDELSNEERKIQGKTWQNITIKDLATVLAINGEEDARYQT